MSQLDKRRYGNLQDIGQNLAVNKFGEVRKSG